MEIIFRKSYRYLIKLGGAVLAIFSQWGHQTKKGLRTPEVGYPLNVLRDNYSLRCDLEMIARS